MRPTSRAGWLEAKFESLAQELHERFSGRVTCGDLVREFCLPDATDRILRDCDEILALEIVDVGVICGEAARWAFQRAAAEAKILDELLRITRFFPD